MTSINTLVSVPSKFLTYYLSLGILLNYNANVFERRMYEWQKATLCKKNSYCTVGDSGYLLPGTCHRHSLQAPPRRALSKHVISCARFDPQGLMNLELEKLLYSSVKPNVQILKSSNNCVHITEAFRSLERITDTEAFFWKQHNQFKEIHHFLVIAISRSCCNEIHLWITTVVRK